MMLVEYRDDEGNIARFFEDHMEIEEPNGTVLSLSRKQASIVMSCSLRLLQDIEDAKLHAETGSGEGSGAGEAVPTECDPRQ